MAFNYMNTFPQYQNYPTYNTYVPQVPQTTQMQQAQQSQQSNGIIWVQGEQAARAYMVAPNTTVLLMDADSQKFYIKSADASGMPLPIRIFAYEEVKPTKVDVVDSRKEEYVTRTEFEQKIAELGGANHGESSI